MTAACPAWWRFQSSKMQKSIAIIKEATLSISQRPERAWLGNSGKEV